MNLIRELYSRRDPNGVVLIEPGGRSFATAEALEQTRRYAAALHQLGVRPGDRVSFKLEKAPEVVFLAHACIQIGAVLHPLNTGYTDVEIDYLLDDAEPALLVCEPGEATRFEGMGRVGRRLETLSVHGGGTLGARAARARRREEIAELDGDATAAILYTSGTTGKPKGAKITHRNLAESARALASVWRLGTADVLLHALPIYHAHGLLTSINTVWVSGGALLFLPRFDAAEVIAQLSVTTAMMGVPTHYARLLREPAFAAALTPAFRLVISGSAPLPQALAAEFEARTGREIIERYGSTEAAIVTAVPAGTKGRSGWVGWPLPGVEVRVTTSSGSQESRAAAGILETRGHNVFAGYWKNGEADPEAFTADGWFVTGDIAEIDDLGCVRLLGRAKDLIISGGLNVYPREIEAVLDTLQGVAESAVFAAPHADFGEAVVAAVELEPNAAFDEAAALAMLRTKLAAFKLPKRIVAIDAIPRNVMGKVLKGELRAKHRNLFVPPECNSTKEA
ncbi:MAG: AMP-binding protein [Pseudomonadota bacterium]|nr:AMP-binding protein [Pseudomonadota bacterium]